MSVRFAGFSLSPFRRSEPENLSSVNDANRNPVITLSADAGHLGAVNISRPDPVAQINALVAAYKQQHPRIDHGEALKIVAAANRELCDRANAASLTVIGAGGIPIPPEQVTPPQPGKSATIEFDALVNDHRAKTGADYGTAMAAVARQNPELAERRRAEFASVVTL
jgi:hypothetical protein